MTPAALSRLTWTEDDRRAWRAAYAHARRIDRRRRRLAGSARVREYDVVRGPFRGYEDGRFSVHADVLEREGF